MSGPFDVLMSKVKDTSPKNNFSGATAPTVNDDRSEGYTIGSTWVDTSATPMEIYQCVSNTDGAAVWINTSLTIAELGSLALINSPCPVVNGGTGATTLSAFLLAANNLSNLASKPTARTNLDLGTAAVQNVAAFLQTANNSSDGVADTMLTNLGVTAFAKTILDDADAGTARGTLGLGTAAVEAATAFELRTSDANVWCVSKTGNDGSGTGKTLGTAFLTFGAAVTAAAAGDVILGWPGIYAEDLAV
ncbi:MAG: hypothetical protein KKC50_08080, partial [Candidatus Omnitrophica bacterium]|nr:hypothetical protein [Candidatus Omnitrophota bacterium]